MNFKPTYLYIKQHSTTGKLYFGKTIKSDPINYQGSGKHWLAHINKHGADKVVTLWYQLYDNLFDLVADAISMTNKLNIVQSTSWLNILPEYGISINKGFQGRLHSTQTKVKISEKIKVVRANNHRQISAETRLKISDATKNTLTHTHPNTLKAQSSEGKAAISRAGSKIYNFINSEGVILENITMRELSILYHIPYQLMVYYHSKNRWFYGFLRL